MLNLHKKNVEIMGEIYRSNKKYRKQKHEKEMSESPMIIYTITLMWNAGNKCERKLLNK